MTESDFYQKYIKKFLKDNGRFFFRVEHARLPDIYTAKLGKVLWIELKTDSKIAKGPQTLIPDWRPGQLSWIKEHAVNGGELICLCLWFYGNFCFLKPKEIYTIDEVIKLQQEKDHGFGKFE